MPPTSMSSRVRGQVIIGYGKRGRALVSHVQTWQWPKVVGLAVLGCCGSCGGSSSGDGGRGDDAWRVAEIAVGPRSESWVSGLGRVVGTFALPGTYRAHE